MSLESLEKNYIITKIKVQKLEEHLKTVQYKQICIKKYDIHYAGALGYYKAKMELYRIEKALKKALKKSALN